ncbi:DUF2264 domain-containing protein [Streptomyces sp. 3MP-14]|uniref:DUF2264 domain-containing protein n=1 Tax=Streptomyces mimosae TaxID=2586635 RepID=A0A5N6AGK8_9ACTN|nr:DUF2264 domain-containing protein [Streptomyces mimosae]KAB8177235.1 DUF2264 domain-containing protein [Streptomyces sp. 3MP-14]
MSPYTGWTRRHFEDHADLLLRGARRHASPGHALILPPGPNSSYGPRSDGLEGFARTFLTAAFRLAGAGGADPLGLADWYARGLAAGTDPEHPEAWPSLTEVPQARVEAASVALALHETRPWIWDRLDDAVRQRVVAWLSQSLGLVYYATNWVWFQNVTEAFLASVGAEWRPEDVERNLATHESFYRADGWYSDGGQGHGGPRAFDHYNGWALHLYPLWWTTMAPDHPAALAQRPVWRERLRRHLADLVHTVGADGAPLHQGRSLTYRFAAAAPFWVGALHDATPLPPGQTRRAAVGIVKHFADHGAPDANGLLTLGWHRELPAIKQYYSGPGSPYWASKGMAGLLLPPDHPVWTARERPLPVEEGDTALTVRPTGWLLRGTARDGVIRVYNHGADHAPPGESRCDDVLYSAVGYSGASAPGSRPEAHLAPLESTLCLLDDAERPSHRRAFRPVAVGGASAVSVGRAHWVEMGGRAPHEDPLAVTEGPELWLASVVNGPWEVRIGRIAPGAGPFRLRVGGWSLAGATPPRAAAEAGRAAVHGERLSSVLVPLRGFDRAGVSAFAGDNPLGEHSAVPWLTTAGPIAPGEVVAALVGLGAGLEAPDPGPALTVDGPEVTVAWPDGARETVRLAP